MQIHFRGPFSVCIVSLLTVLLSLPQGLLAQEHVVTAAQLHRDLVAASQTRQNNQAAVLKFLSSDLGQKALKSAHVPYQTAQKAVAQLSDQELARLAARTDQLQADFAAGRLTQNQTYILVAVIAVVVVLLIVIAARG